MKPNETKPILYEEAVFPQDIFESKMDSSEYNVQTIETVECFEEISNDLDESATDNSFYKSSINLEGEDIHSRINELISKNGDIWQCDLCGKSATHRGNLKRHISTHVDGECYNCSKCGKTFRSKHSLQNHNSIFHKNLK